MRTYLPWSGIESKFPPITVHDMLTHTAGIINGSDLAPYGYYEVSALRDSRRVTGPGERFHDSNVGFKTLGLLFEAVRSEPLGEILQGGILQPLGMTESFGSITQETRLVSATAYRPSPQRPYHSPRPSWLA